MEHFISHWNQLIEENEKLNVVLGLALSTKLNKGKLVTILLYINLLVRMIGLPCKSVCKMVVVVVCGGEGEVYI